MAEGRIDLLSIGWRAAAPISKYCAVKLSDADHVTPVTAEGDLIVGISQFGVTAAEIDNGKGASVQVHGVSLVLVGVGGVTFGTIVVSDATGKAVASNAGGRPLGICLASGSAADWVPVLLTPGLPVV